MSDGDRQKRLTARALWPEQHGPTARCRKPLSGRWLTAIRLAALRPTVVIPMVIEGLQAAEVVKGGGAQSRSQVVGQQGKGAIGCRPYNKSLKPTAVSSVYVGVVLAMGLTLAEKSEYN